MRRDHRFQRVPRTPKHRVESLSNATMEDRWEEETFSQLDVCKLFLLSTNPLFLYPSLINNLQLCFCSPCESIRRIRVTLYDNFIGCRCVFPSSDVPFYMVILFLSFERRTLHMYEVRLHLPEQSQVFRKNVSRNTF